MSSTTGQQAGHAQVLVDVGPVDPFAVAKELPVLPFGWRRCGEARRPGERDLEAPTIDELDPDLAIGDLDVEDAAGSWHEAKATGVTTRAVAQRLGNQVTVT
jgi:hypothetical protein